MPKQKIWRTKKGAIIIDHTLRLFVAGGFPEGTSSKLSVLHIELAARTPSNDLVQLLSETKDHQNHNEKNYALIPARKQALRRN
ncbi:MAG: hypothetical protein KHY61_09690, partial [Sutterella wadsworthensis]|nr:hypothetical protein [Sutterella wadsworthensis]